MGKSATRKRPRKTAKHNGECHDLHSADQGLMRSSDAGEVWRLITGLTRRPPDNVSTSQRHEGEGSCLRRSLPREARRSGIPERRRIAPASTGLSSAFRDRRNGHRLSSIIRAPGHVVRAWLRPGPSRYRSDFSTRASTNIKRNPSKNSLSPVGKLPQWSTVTDRTHGVRPSQSMSPGHLADFARNRRQPSHERHNVRAEMVSPETKDRSK